MKITANVQVNSEEIISELVASRDYKGIVSFIKDLDMLVADWDFTLMLITYFDEQKKLYEDENKYEEEYT